MQEAAYGSVGDFNRGLEVVGVPHPRAPEEMRKEFCDKEDSHDIFESWNSGGWRACASAATTTRLADIRYDMAQAPCCLGNPECSTQARTRARRR